MAIVFMVKAFVASRNFQSIILRTRSGIQFLVGRGMDPCSIVYPGVSKANVGHEWGPPVPKNTNVIIFRAGHYAYRAARPGTPGSLALSALLTTMMSSQSQSVARVHC